MSLIENFVNQISTQNSGGISKPQSFDLNDDTFAKLLEKSLNTVEAVPQQGHQIAGLGAPAGIFIEPINGNIEPPKTDNKITEPLEIKDVDLGDNYFSNVLKKSPQQHESIMNVAKKHAAAAYNIYKNNLVEDLTDFAKDALSML